MKTYFLFFFTLFFAVPIMAQTNFETREIAILPNSNLSITGTSNITDFACDFNTLCFANNSFKVAYTEKNGVLRFKNSILPLENINFDCGNRKINKDFHDLLQTEKHPKILLKLKELDIRSAENALVTLTFNIAGIDKDYKFPIEITRGRELCFDGKLALNIEDFNLEAPKKMFGLIVIDEEIEINFNLNIQI